MEKENQEKIIIANKTNSFLKPVNIGGLITENNIFLAPMAGASDLAYRRICRKHGAGLVFTELSTARGIKYQKSVEKNYRYLEISPEEFPVGIQLFSPEPDDFKRAIEIIFNHKILSKCPLIDINMGCPVQKVVKTGAGSALMKDPQKAAEIIKASIAASPVPVSVKIRKGWNEQNTNAVDFAKMCEQSGASMISVHGRTTNQMYSGKADWDIIAKVKRNVQIPVIGNGDVICEKTAKSMFEETNVDGIMIGRGALGNPWIFERIISYLQYNNFSQEQTSYTEPSNSERIDLMKDHLFGAISTHGELTAIKEMRKHFAWYLKRIPHTNKIKQQIMLCTTIEEVLELIDSLQK